jgi:hypothetical protein
VSTFRSALLRREPDVFAYTSEKTVRVSWKANLIAAIRHRKAFLRTAYPQFCGDVSPHLGEASRDRFSMPNTVNLV